MKKRIKVGIGELRVSSFVTSLHDSESGEIKGGTQLSCPQNCRTIEFRGCAVTPHQVCQIHSRLVCNSSLSYCC